MRKIKRSAKKLFETYLKFYKEQGLNVIPIAFKEKRAAEKWKEYQDRKATNEEIKKWFLTGAVQNIAIVCGVISDNLVVVDFDDPKVYKKIFGKAAKDKSTFVVRTGKGIHVYFKTENPVRSFRIEELSIDVKGEGGYVLAPPSVHPSGREYKEERMIDIEHVEGDFVEELFMIIKSKIKKFDPNDYREEIDIGKIMGGVEEGERNESAIRLATWYRQAGLEIEHAREKMKAWNQKNQPPMDPQELLRTIESAYLPDKPYGYKFSKSVVEREFFTEEDIKQAEELLSQTDIIPFLEEKALGDVVKEKELKVWLFFLNLIGQSVQVHGKTSSGKSHTCDKVLECYPRHTWFKITGVSDKAIRYLPDNIHTLYLTEWRSAQSGQKDVESTAEFDIKLVISEGKLRIIVVERNEDGKLETRIIETSINNIVSTSTAEAIPRELLNRIWEMTTDLTINPDVVGHKIDEGCKFRSGRKNCEPDRKILRCAIEILRKEAPKQFVVPFARELSPLLKPIMHEPRVRRDVDKLLDAVRALALLHYRNRPIVNDPDTGEAHLICLPQDFYYAWLYGHEAIIGTFTGQTKRYEDVISAITAMKEKSVPITSTTLSHALNLKSRDSGYKWLRRLEDDNIVVRADEKKGTAILYEYAGTIKEPVKVTIKLSDLFDATEKWFKENNIKTTKSRIRKPQFKKFFEEKIETQFPVRDFVLSVEERIAKMAEEGPEDWFKDDSHS